MFNVKNPVSIFSTFVLRLLKKKPLSKGINALWLFDASGHDKIQSVSCQKVNGIGIKEKDLPIIFAPFKRLHGNKEFPGVGLGLTMCMKIAKRHEGKLWAESDGKSGACFYFTIAKALTPCEKP